MACLLLEREALQSAPTWVFWFRVGAVAGSVVQVFSAGGAEAFAMFAAERPSGQGKEHLLPHDILQQQAGGSIIPYFGLVFCDGALAGFGVGGLGAEEEVETAGERDLDGLDATCAEDLEGALIVGADADVLDDFLGSAMLDDEVGFALDGERAELAGVGSVVDGLGSDLLVEFEGFVLELERGD